jgi:hypothetical protein
VYDALAAENCDVIVTDDMQEFKRMAKEHDNSALLGTVLPP